MEVNFAFLCDYADQSGGKMSAIGLGFDTIYAVNVPVRHSLFFSVISIKFSATEAGPKRVGMHLIDEDGNNIVPPLDTTINVSSPAPGFLYRNQQIALAMHGITFPRYGDYTVSWLVGGQEIKVVPLKVAQPPAPPTTA
ncbi:hypothetical protein ES703_85144 [subsurface metagenome]